MRKSTDRTRRSFQVGDRIAIINFRRNIAWGDRKPQEFGFIVKIDGAYILVRPRWWKNDELIEFYPGEIKLALLAR